MPPLPFADPGPVAAVTTALADDFGRRHGREPAVVACAPGRVNLIGEHLDYNAGRCLPFALPHATYAAVASREDGVLAVSSLQAGAAEPVQVAALAPGAVDGWAAYVAGVVWALREDGWDLPGLDVVVDSHVPLGSGLSSSAALECSVAVALLEVAGVEDTPAVRRTLARACVRAETEMAGAPTGGMDQAVSLFGAVGEALLLDFADGSQRLVPWAPERDGLALLVVDTRVSHTLTDGSYGNRRAECEAAARLLEVEHLPEARGRSLDDLDDPVLRRRVRHVLTEVARVDSAVEALEAGDHAALGPLLDASHDSLRDDFEISCEELDLVVDTSRAHGALGARMTGGGFGGSAIVLLPAARLEPVATEILSAFSARGHREPRFLRAPASAAARRLR